MSRWRNLLAERNSGPIGVGLVGATYMGTGVLSAVKNAIGMEIVAIHDADKTLATRAAADYAPKARILELEELCADPAIEVVIDGTANPLIGAQAADLAISNGKHVVSVDIECDATVGQVLAARAKNKGVVYTTIAGDEPAELKFLYDHYDALGFEIVALGKGKNNPLNTQAVPDDVRGKLPDNGITAEQVISFVDGSKTMFEMGCLGNAIGFGPDIVGMHGPECTLAEILERYRSKESGGILSREGVVDYVTGPEISGGVWIVVRSDDARLQSDFRYLKIGQGPYYMFYQRFHNWFVDTPISILRAVLLKMGTAVPRERLSCRVVAMAKRDIQPGQVLEGIGQCDVFGRLHREEEALDKIPLGMAEGAKATKAISQGEAVYLRDVELPSDGTLCELWKESCQK